MVNFNYNYFTKETFESIQKNIREMINFKLLYENSDNEELCKMLIDDFFTFDEENLWVTSLTNTKTFYVDNRNLTFKDLSTNKIFSFKKVQELKNCVFVYVSYNEIGGIYTGYTTNFGERQRTSAKESLKSKKTNDFLRECMEKCNGICYTKILHAFPFNQENFEKVKKYAREVEKQYNYALKDKYTHNKVG